MDEYPNGNYCNTCTQECTNRLFKLLAYTRVAHSALALYLSLSTLAFIVYVRYFSSYYHLQCTRVYTAAKDMFLSVVFVMYFDYFLSGFPNYIQPWDICRAPAFHSTLLLHTCIQSLFRSETQCVRSKNVERKVRMQSEGSKNIRCKRSRVKQVFLTCTMGAADGAIPTGRVHWLLDTLQCA